MKAPILYRIASFLIALFAAGHTLGFRNIDPSWGVGGVVQSMKLVRFTAQGFTRTYYDFYTGFGLFVSALLFFAAWLAWQLAAMASQPSAPIRGIAWGLAACFVATAALSWRYFFALPIVFSGLISLCLLAAAWATEPAHR